MGVGKLNLACICSEASNENDGTFSICNQCFPAADNNRDFAEVQALISRQRDHQVDYPFFLSF